MQPMQPMRRARLRSIDRENQPEVPLREQLGQLRDLFCYLRPYRGWLVSLRVPRRELTKRHPAVGLTPKISMVLILATVGLLIQRLSSLEGGPGNSISAVPGAIVDHLGSVARGE